MSEGWNITDEFQRQVVLCQGIGFHAMLNALYTQFPAEREHVDKWKSSWEKDQARITELEAELHAAFTNAEWFAEQLTAIEALPDKWRKDEQDVRTATPDDPGARDGDDCANELDAILEQEQGDE